MLVNSFLTSTLLNSINQRQTDKIVDTVAKNKKINLSNEQVKTFKDVLSTELNTMYSKQQLLTSYLNTAGANSSISNPYLSSLGLFGGMTNSMQPSALFGGMGLLSTTSLSNLMPYLPVEGMQKSITPINMATNAYARQIFNNGNYIW